MEARILRKDNLLYLQLPPEFSQAADIELFKLREGYYLISLPLGQAQQVQSPQLQQPQQSSSSTLGAAEKSILKKLSNIRFENRTQKQIAQSFSKEEQEMLSQMEKKGLVKLFKSAKYKDGVYSIPDSVYPLLRGGDEGIASVPQPTATVPYSAASPIDPFFKQGYVVFANNNEAASFSDSIKRAGRSQDILGIKGFDGRFYVVTKNYMMDTSGRIRAALKGDDAMTAQMIAKACNMDEPGCRAVLLLMAEKGDVIEKKKGIFVLV